MTTMGRPIGVTILAILEIIEGLVFLGYAALLSALSATALTSIPFVGPIIAAIFGAVAIVLIILGIAGFVLAYGLWGGKGWAWTLSIIFAVIGILVGLVTLPNGIVIIIIDALIIYYLMQSQVKAFFGKAPQLAPSPPPPTAQ